MPLLCDDFVSDPNNTSYFKFYFSLLYIAVVVDPMLTLGADSFPFSISLFLLAPSCFYVDSLVSFIIGHERKRIFLLMRLSPFFQ